MKFKNVFLPALAMSVLSVAAFAEPIEEVAATTDLKDKLLTCQSIANNTERLSCYDALTDINAAPSDEVDPQTAANSESQVSTWTLIEHIDAISGENWSRAYVDAISRIGGNDAPEYLMLQCDGKGGFDLFIGTTGYIGNRRDRTRVEYRWADNSATSETWNGSTSGKAAFLPKSYRDFMAGLMEGGELVFRWFDYRGVGTSASWSNLELDHNAKFVMDGCGE